MRPQFRVEEIQILIQRSWDSKIVSGIQVSKPTTES